MRAHTSASRLGMRCVTLVESTRRWCRLNFRRGMLLTSALSRPTDWRASSYRNTVPPHPGLCPAPLRGTGEAERWARVARRAGVIVQLRRGQPVSGGRPTARESAASVGSELGRAARTGISGFDPGPCRLRRAIFPMTYGRRRNRPRSSISRSPNPRLQPMPGALCSQGGLRSAVFPTGRAMPPVQQVIARLPLTMVQTPGWQVRSPGIGGS